MIFHFFWIWRNLGGLSFAPRPLMLNPRAFNAFENDTKPDFAWLPQFRHGRGDRPCEMHDFSVGKLSPLYARQTNYTLF